MDQVPGLGWMNDLFLVFRLIDRHQHLAHAATPTHKPFMMNTPSFPVNVSSLSLLKHMLICYDKRFSCPNSKT